MNRKDLEAFIASVLNDPADNRFTEETACAPEDAGAPVYDAPVVCVGSAADPLWIRVREEQAVGPVWKTPAEWLPEAKSVISIFAPFTHHVLNSNAKDPVLTGSAWLSGYNVGGALIKRAGKRTMEMLRELGYKAVCPVVDEKFQSVSAPGTNPDLPGLSYTSNWSERHAAFVCGQGTFGLSRGLITRRGIAGRFSSVITDLELEPDVRVYEGVYDFCTMCGRCAENCPAKAISLEEGKKHYPCNMWLNHMGEVSHVSESCGKCQVNVPCMDRIPAPAFRHLSLLPEE